MAGQAALSPGFASGYGRGMKAARLIPLFLVPAVLALGACQKADTAPGPGGVTMGEARALDEAAAMLDERRPPAAALQPAGAKAPVNEAKAR